MKKYLFGLFAVALAVAFSAYTTVDVFQYKFEGTNLAQLNQPSLWVEGEGGEECGSSGTVCFVESTSDLSTFRSQVSAITSPTVQKVENLAGVTVMDEKAIQ